MAYQPFSHKEVRRFFAFFWLFAFLLLQFTWQYFFELSWGIVFTDNILSIILLVLCIGVVNKSNYVAKVQGYQYIPAYVFLSLLSILCVALNVAVLYYLNINNETYHIFLWNSLPFRFLYSLFILTGFTFMNFIWQKLIERKKEHQKAENIRKMAKEAELNKIYQQLHPHFLFNSLNAIKTLIVSSPKKASNMIQKLSDFLRGSIKKVDEEFILFQDEVNHLNLYLALEKIRFGKRLKTKLKIEEDSLKSTIPPLILQPLIENAIKFGIYGTLGDVTIYLKSRVSENYLHLSIVNPFDEDAQPPTGTGFGLKSVKRRLFLLYGRNDLVLTQKRKDIFLTSLKIPQYYDKNINN